MDNDEIVGVSPQALRWLRGFVVSAAVRIHDLGELTQSEVINKPPLNTPRVQELNQELAATSLYRMRIVANALAGMAKYLDERATYQELVSGGGAGGVEPPRYPGFMPEDPNHLLNLGIGGLQVGGGIAGAAAILAVLPEPLVSKIAAGGLALYSLFVADAGVRTIMSGGETVAEPYPDQAVEWAALRAGLSQQDAAGIKHSFAFSMGTVTMVAPLAGAGMIRHSVITTNVAEDTFTLRYVGEVDSEHARIYETIRRDRGDVQAIVDNVGVDAGVVSRVKQHTFFDEHTIPTGPGQIERGQFAPDPRIAELWPKARTGTLDPVETVEFRRLLSHEYVEARLEAAGLPHRSPHPDAWDADLINRPTPLYHGAHDLAPITDPMRAPFVHWPAVLGRPIPDLPIALDLSNLDDVVRLARGR